MRCLQGQSSAGEGIVGITREELGVREVQRGESRASSERFKESKKSYDKTPSKRDDTKRDEHDKCSGGG